MPETVPCPGCRGDRLEAVFEDCRDLWFGVPGSFSVVRCMDCGLTFTSPRPARDELDAFYPDVYAPEGFPTPDRPMGRSAPARAVRWVAALPYRWRWGRGFVAGLDPGKVLDIGAGDGSRLARLEAEGWEPWLLEPRPEIARATAEKLGIPAERAIVGYAEDADLPEASFDLAVMDHTVEHLSDPGVVFDSIAAWLRPGGRLLITCPNYGSLESRLFGRSWFGLEMPRHLLHFTVGTLEALAGRSGLVTEDVRPQYGVLVVPSFVFRRANRRRSGRGLDSALVRLPGRAAAIGLELLATVAQAFGYMPMMEVVFRKPATGPGETA